MIGYALSELYVWGLTLFEHLRRMIKPIVQVINSIT